MSKGPEAFRTISEASQEIGVAQHVLRFWETKFTFIRPMKRTGGRRFYRPRDIAALAAIKRMLYEEGLSIKAVQALHRERGLRALNSTIPSEIGEPGPHERTVRLQVALEALEAARDKLNELLGGR